MSLILHLNASTAHAPDPDAKHLVTGVEAALRLGADAVSVHINMGSRKRRGSSPTSERWPTSATAGTFRCWR